jgi:GNAT superfamily N-acetyltransferase
MYARCFECAATLEGPTAEAVVEAFVLHGQTAHRWDYPAEAIRNYARNFAEAAERLTGGTERLESIAEITVHPVTADRIDDWLAFFDHDGFAGNPDWASCYCLEPHIPAPPELPERPWRSVREATVTRLRDGGTYGYLAYAGGKAAGWVNASLRADYGLYRDVDPAGPAAASVVAVSCFVIAPPFRRHGIAAALLDHVIVDASARGASWIEGFPRTAPDDSDAAHFRGPRSMYEARGFTAVVERDEDVVMRRPARG